MKAPAVFVAHGAPSLALQDDVVTRALRAFGETLDGARAIAVVSAHWETRGGVRVNAAAKPEVIYDFGGFSPELYKVRYDAAGSPELAREIATLLDAPLERERGWDHGLWVPMLHVLPEARTPIVEIALPRSADLLQLGRTLAPLRERGVAIAGSGGIVHNLRMIDFSGKNAPPFDWAVEFDQWIADRIEARDFNAVAEYRSAPNARLAVPTPEHFEPLLIALGAAHADDRLQTIYEGFQYGSLSMRSIALS